MRLPTIAIFLAVLALAAPVIARAAEERVAWDATGNFASALTRAQKAKKLVFVDFYAVWCGPCKMMDRTVYTDSTVALETARYLSRKVDAEKGEGIELARRYKVDAYPTLLVVDAAGKELAREVGYRPADKFRLFLEDTRTGRGTIEGVRKLLAAKGGDTFDNRVALGNKLVDAAQAPAARDEYDRALTLDPTDPGGRAGELLVRIARTRLDGGDAVGAIADVDGFLARFPSTPLRLDALEIKGNAHAARGEKDSAAAAWRGALEIRGSSDPSALVTFARSCATHAVALDEALAAATKAVDLTGGKDATALDALAEVYGARGQYDDAVSTAERAVDASPNQGYLRAKLERFQEMAVAAVRAKSQ